MAAPPPGISRRTKAFALSGAIAATLSVLFVNVLAARHYRRWDASRAKLYTLSEPTLFTLAQIEREHDDVELFVFIGAGDPLLTSVKAMLAGYEAKTRRLRVTYLDPDRNRAEFMRLQSELDVHVGKAEQGRILADAQIVARHGSRVWYVKTDDLVVLDEGDDAKVKPRVESALTGAIRAVLSTDRPRVCFTGGHREASIDEPGKEGLSTLKNTLAKDNFAPEVVELGKAKPGQNPLVGCSMIAVMAPTEPFRADEAKPIVDAVVLGANLLLVAPPEVDLETRKLKAHGLDAVGALGGVALDDAIAVEQDPMLRETHDLGLIFRARVHAHATTDDLRKFAEARGGEAAVPLAYARPLRRTNAAAMSAQELLVSSDQSFALFDVGGFLASHEEPKKGPSDRAGPLDLAVATTRDKAIGGARVVVIGSSTPFLNAAYVDPSPAMALSRTLGLLWVSWLTARPPVLDLPPKPSVQIAMHLSEDDIGSIGRYVLAYMPLAIGMLGIAVALRRRSTEGKRVRGKPAS
jgi:hypothetical protein